MKTDIVVECFGRIVMEMVRDEVCDINERVLCGQMGEEEIKSCLEKIEKICPNHKDILSTFARRSVDYTIHYFLWMIEQEDSLDIVYKNKSGNKFSLKELSDGLYGEPYGDNGWIKKFSKYPSSVE